LRTTAIRIKEAKPAATMTGVDELEVKLPRGPATLARKPMMGNKKQRQE
jgi:hypothetical protein